MTAYPKYTLIQTKNKKILYILKGMIKSYIQNIRRHHHEFKKFPFELRFIIFQVQRKYNVYCMELLGKYHYMQTPCKQIRNNLIKGEQKEAQDKEEAFATAIAPYFLYNVAELKRFAN